jgi:hypothetical protein
MPPERVFTTTTTSSSSTLDAPNSRFTTGQSVADADIINTACEAIYQRWSRYVSHEEALEEARAFARRCASISQSQQLSDTELDAVIASVAEAMAEP